MLIDKLLLNQKIDNFSRKLIHIFSAIIIFFFPYFLTLNQIIFVSILFSVVFLIARYVGFLGVINRVKRLSWGEIFYPLGIALVAIAFLPDSITSFQLGVLVLGFSDALANIFGGLFGSYKIKIMGGTKSLEGSLVFLLSTLFLLLIFSNGDPILLHYYLLVAVILTLIEFSLFFGLDNLVLPLLAAYLHSLL